MAGIRWSWTKTLVLIALVFAWGAGPVAVAQAPAARNGGAIAGRLTDLHSVPLAGATVVARNEATGAEMRTTTARNGSYRFTGLDPGEYTLEAESEQLGRGRLEGIFVSAGHEARVQAAMEFEAAAPGLIQAASIPAIQAPSHPVIKTAPASAIENAVNSAIGTASAPGTRTVSSSAARATSIPPNQIARRPIILTTSNPEIETISLPLIQAENLALAGSSAHFPVRAAIHTIAAVTPQVTTEVAAEPLLAIPIAGQDSAKRLRPESAAGKPAVGSPPMNAVIAEQAILPLALKGRPWAGESSPILAEAAGAVTKAATLLSQSKLNAALAATRPDIDPVTPVVTTTVTGEQLQALPLSGRRWQDFVLDAPTAATPAGGADQVSLRGAGQEPIETTIDGASTRLAFGGQNSSEPASQTGADQNGMGQAWSSGHGFSVAEAAIREVQTVAGNVEAEGSRAAGGRMNVETERGRNGLHGQGFVFDRQNTWGAQNPFTQWVKETAPATETTTPLFTPESFTPPDHEMTWGLGAGSQMPKDKLFWFAALDSYRRNDPGLAMVKHPYLSPTVCEIPPCSPTGFFAQPSNDQMQVLSARLGLSGSNPVAEGLAAYSKELEALAGLLGPAPRTATQWTGFSRIDWQIAERHRLTLEGMGATWDSPGGGLTRVSETYGTNSFGSSQASESWLLARWEGFVTPNLLLVTQGSMGRNIQGARPETPSAFEQAFLSPNVWGQLPQIVVDSRYGFTIGNPSRFGQGSYPDERLYQAQESVDWVRGKLMVKAGFDVNHNFDVTSLLRNQTGTYNYSSVYNFVSDALSFAAFGVAGELNPANQHNCDQTGKVWRDSTGTLHGLGYLPCYSSYSQLMGPTVWHLSTNDWAGYETTQWQVSKLLVFSAGLRWEREQLPPPIAALANAELPLTEKLPSLGNSWGPRVSLALGSLETHWPVLRIGYGLYFGRTENATVETALTQTGSFNGDLNIFMRPTDNLNAGGAPPFPYVLAGEPGNVVKPGAVEFAPQFRNPEIHQGVVALEEELPGHVQLTAGALVSLGRRLPVPIDANIFDPAVKPGTITYAVEDSTGAGPIKAPRITVPFYDSWPTSTGSAGWLKPEYQQIDQIVSMANSSYEAAMLKVTRYGRRGLSLHAHYTYAHAMDWNPDVSPLDPAADFRQEYGTSNLDVRHSAVAMVIYEAPWKLHGAAGRFANGWMVSGIGNFRSGLPYTMRISGPLPECVVSSGVTSCTSPYTGLNVAIGTPIVGLRPGMNGSGGDNRVYGMGSDGQVYNIGRNTFRYPATWKADMRVGKSFDFGHMRQLELLAESFNLFNHQNVTELETTGYTIEPGSTSGPPTLNFLTGVKANTTAFGQPLNINATDFFRERQIQFGVRLRF
jgi:hypothetical protein